jgi:hypothetical protein
MAWEYDRLYDYLIPHSFGLPDALLNHEFAVLRGQSATRALVSACHKHGVPYELKQLECNGQRKLLVKIGRVVLIQEPMSTLTDHPKVTDYKIELAESHGILRQPEIDLGDIAGRILDWSGCILGVDLHGATGPWFTKEHKQLGGLILGIPDAAYDHWIHRFDLLHIAMFDSVPSLNESLSEQPVNQEDRVIVTRKKKNSAAKGADE